MEEMPSQQIQDMVEQYCLYKPLVRPKTSWRTAAVTAFLFLAVSLILTFIVIKISNLNGVFSYLPQWFVEIKEKHPFLEKCIVYFIVSFVMLFFSLRYILIGLVHIYQHYADEEIRRRCLLRPTCSEYMILSIEKFGSLIGGIKGIYRLLFVCRGNIYRIDYPYRRRRKRNL